MKNWKSKLNTASKSDALFEASAAETYYKLIALVKVMQKVRTQLTAEEPHAVILATMDEWLKVGLQPPQPGQEGTDATI